MATILRLKDIGKVSHIERTKEQVVALGGISLEVAQGEFLVLVGPSGCCKSTLLQIIAGLEKPASGTFELTQASDGQKQTNGFSGIRPISLAHGAGKYRLRSRSEKYSESATRGERSAIDRVGSSAGL
jgi:ABC-type oligopeptide transport system ATPase subunit